MDQEWREGESEWIRNGGREGVSGSGMVGGSAGIRLHDKLYHNSYSCVQQIDGSFLT